MFVDRGTYSGVTTYSKWDMVHTTDSTYVSKIDNNVGNAVDDPNSWVCIANGKPATEAAAASYVQRVADHNVYVADHQTAVDDHAQFVNFESGTYPDFTAGDIIPKSDLPNPVTNKFAIQSTGGDADVKNGPSLLDSIKGNIVNISGVLEPFIADSFVSTGMNLVDPTQYYTVGETRAYYFPVVAGQWGQYGAKLTNNGYIVFGKAAEVYYSATKPTNGNFGAACPKTTYNGKDYYTPDTGWLTIIAPEEEVPACHLAWSNYNDLVPGTFANVVKSISTALQAVHPWGLAALFGANRSVFDELDFVAGHGYARIDRITPATAEWTMTTYEQGESNPVTHHVFRATVADMAVNGLWNCLYEGLTVEGNTLVVDSTTIDNLEDFARSWGLSEYFYYEKASVVSTNIANAAAMRSNTADDFGLNYFLYNGELVSVPSFVTEEFYQTGKIQIFNCVDYVNGELNQVLAAAIADLQDQVNGILGCIKDGFPKLSVQELSVKRTLEAYPVEGNFFIGGAGAPTMIPQFNGQHYYDTTNGVWYVAGFTGTEPTAAAWKQITNA